MSAFLRVLLKRGRSKPFWVGHPWVFSGAIERVVGTGSDEGGACVVEDERGNVLGSGYYNPRGIIAVRLFEHRRTTDRGYEPRGLAAILPERLSAAVARREVLGLPSDATDTYRLVNSEGDGLSGLVVDRIGSAVVAHVNSRAMTEARHEIARLLAELVRPDRVVVAVGEEASRIEGIAKLFEVHPGAGGATAEGPVLARENGVRYRVQLDAGQKTGFYADQRDNRLRFAALCEGRSVLDLCCYAGGFGLVAAARGASHVTGVDSSGPAIEAAVANADLNGVRAIVEPQRADAVAFLKDAVDRGRTWQRVVCDPPKFARGQRHVDEALKKYARLNTLAMSALAPDGVMLTCSCSQHVSTEAFLRMLTDAGHRLRRNVHVHAVWTQGPDHPFAAVAPEGHYLKAVLLGTSEG